MSTESTLENFKNRMFVTQIVVLSGMMIGFAIAQYVGLATPGGRNGKRVFIASSVAGIFLLAHFGIVDAFLIGELDKKIATRLSAVAVALMGCATATTDGYFVLSFLTFSRTVPYPLQRLLRIQIWISGTTILANLVFSIIATAGILLDNQFVVKSFIVATHSASMATDFMCGMIGYTIISQFEEASMEAVQHYLRKQKYLITATRALTVCLSCSVITMTASSNIGIGRVIQVFIVPSRVIGMYGILNRRKRRHEDSDCEVYFVPSSDAFNFDGSVELTECRGDDVSKIETGEAIE